MASTLWLLSTGGVPPCSRWQRSVQFTSVTQCCPTLCIPMDCSTPDGDIDTFYTEAFLPWLDLVCPLLMQVLYSSLPALPPRWGGDAPGVDLVSSQTDLVPYHQDLCFICPFLWCHPGWIKADFGMFSKPVLLGESSILHVPVHIPEYSPDFSGMVSHKGMNN